MKVKHTLLVVDDEPANLHKLKRTFIDDYHVIEATSGEEALRLLARHAVVAIITDQRMPGLSGVELLRRSLEIRPDAVRVILTGYTEVEDLMDAINQGHVHRYITKPWEPRSLLRQVGREIQRWELERENEQLARELERANEHLRDENLKLRREVEYLSDSSDQQLVYRSRAMGELLELLDRVIPTDSTVLIQGETGTGKELLARHIHRNSPRHQAPFVAVNCAAIPADLVESAFFGHHKGAFTGASEDRKGYFELADEGTIFLDEIGEAPMDLQVKLLRVLQEDEIFPVGAEQPREVNVRVIASTNRTLAQRVEEGLFRQDLFFRLNVFAVHVPPLRARREDIEVLSEEFLERFRARLAKDVPGFEAETLEILKGYDWPGNVRELENEIERMLILCDAGRAVSPALASTRLRHPASAPAGAGRLREELAELERRLILDALKAHGNNKSRAAQVLGITRQTIISKLKQYRDRKAV